MRTLPRPTVFFSTSIRGSQIRLCVVPNILKNAPIFATVADVGSKAQKSAAAARKKGKKGGDKNNLYQQRAADKMGR